MKKQMKKLKLREVVTLSSELNGLPNDNPELVIPSVLNEDLNVKCKYWFKKLAESLKSEVVGFHNMRDELIRKYGTSTEKGITIQMKVESESGEMQPNPDFIKFLKDEHELLDQEIEVNLFQFDIAELDFKCKYPYAQILEHLVYDSE